MQYIICSRGQPIGTTDLGFPRLGAATRSGWFYPNEEGEALMPVVAVVLPAVRAWLEAQDDVGRDIVRTDMVGSELFADVAEAVHRVAGLDLTLHRDDGALIATRIIAVQDQEQLRALVDVDEFDVAASEDEEIPPELQEDIDHDLAIIGEWFADRDRWLPEPESYPRYQVHVLLGDPASVP